MLGPRRRTALLLLALSCGALITSGTASAACIARPLVLLHAGGARTAVKLPPFLRATLICGGDRGLRGLKGATGKSGLAGAIGLTGASGSTGPVGATGAQGDVGPVGATGATGVTGLVGAAGPVGPRGLIGADGQVGGDGPPGPNGTPAPTGYAYVYDTSGQTVALEGDILFNANGPISADFTHVVGAAGITFVTPGTYKVAFVISGTASNQMSTFINGVGTLGGTYGADDGAEQTSGQTILTVSAGNVLTIRNHTSLGAVVLANHAGGSNTSVDASILIERLA
jgi:hypothetical protein